MRRQVFLFFAMSRVMNSNERRREFIKFFLSDALIFVAARIVFLSLQTVAIGESNFRQDLTRVMRSGFG